MAKIVVLASEEDDLPRVVLSKPKYYEYTYICYLWKKFKQILLGRDYVTLSIRMRFDFNLFPLCIETPIGFTKIPQNGCVVWSTSYQ